MQHNDNSSANTSNADKGVCDGCDKVCDSGAMTECRCNYPDESWEWFKFCPDCVKADAF